MGKDRIRYLLFKDGRWRWRPTATMRAAGFSILKLSPGVVIDGKHVPSPDDARRAAEMNAEWDRHRLGLPPLTARSKYPSGSVGDGYERAVLLRQAERAAKGIVWTTEQHSRDDWPRAWKWIEPVLGDCDPKTVTPELLLKLRTMILAKISETEAHRTIKVWRALWRRMAVEGFCVLERDPSSLFANSAPRPRQAVWHEGEAVRLIKAAWRAGYHGLAALLAVAWDSQLSPVDARGLKAGQLRRDPIGAWFEVSRAKTGRGALGTLSRRADRMLQAYMRKLAAEPVGAAPIFRNRSGAAYSKDTLGDDFRAVRSMVFGQSETRQLADFRRSGSVEALAGDASPEKLSSKMANSLSASNRLHKTYGPVMLASVRHVDTARKLGRARLREQNPDKSVRAPGQECPASVQGDPKSLKNGASDGT